MEVCKDKHPKEGNSFYRLRGSSQDVCVFMVTVYTVVGLLCVIRGI